jgi:glucokinase
MNRYVVVSGLPASGKSTVAVALAGELGLPLLDKDDFLEALFESRGAGDAQWRTQLSRAADIAFQAEAERAPGAVLASWWRHPLSLVPSGTPTEWLASLPGAVVELHCRCAPAVAARRFLERQRHPGNLDGRRSHAELLAEFERHAALGPLGLAPVVEIDGEDSSHFEETTRELQCVFSQEATRLGAGALPSR